MKKTILILLAIVGLINNSFAKTEEPNSSAPNTANVKVQVWGEYKGRDSETGRPICNPHPTKPCIMQTYVHDESYAFPLGIISATYENPDSPGTFVSMSSIIQTYNGSGDYEINLGTGATWVGPFSLISGTWSIIP